jgi:Flp pilus assembly pilin Flp
LDTTTAAGLILAGSNVEVVANLTTIPLEGPNMTTLIKNFVASEDGAVTVDWVVLTAAVVGLALAAVAAVRGGVSTLAGNIKTAVSGTAVGP